MGSKDTFGMASKDAPGVIAQATKEMIKMLSVELSGNDSDPDHSEPIKLHVHGRDVNGTVQYNVATCFPAGEHVVPDIWDGFNNGQVTVDATSRNHLVKMRFGDCGEFTYHRFSAPGKGWGTEFE